MIVRLNLFDARFGTWRIRPFWFVHLDNLIHSADSVGSDDVSLGRLRLLRLELMSRRSCDRGRL